jgi:hypothetical protein
MFMKYLFVFIFFPISIFSQRVIPFIDFNYYLRSFQESSSRVVEFQRILNYKGGDEFVAYTDNRGNLRVYDGKAPIEITNLNLEYKISDHLLAWKVTQTINVWESGKSKTLTYNGREFEVRDSLIVFEDLRYNSVNVYRNGIVTQLYTVVDELYMPVYIGDNIVAFKDNGNFYKVYWNGEIYDLGIWNGPIDFQGGMDVLAFNDPTSRTFAIFDRGEFLDVESFFMGKYRAGRGFIAYEDLNNNLNFYSEGEKTQLSNFAAKFWEVKDDLVVWNENSFVYVYAYGQKSKVCNFTPADYLIKNNVFAYRNIMGGVSAFINGVNYEITNQTDSSYEIYGSSVLVKLFNNSYIVLKNGVKYTM